MAATVGGGYDGAAEVRAPEGTVAGTPVWRGLGQVTGCAAGDLPAARTARSHPDVRRPVRGTRRPEPDIVVPPGPRGGVSYAPEAGVPLGIGDLPRLPVLRDSTVAS